LGPAFKSTALEPENDGVYIGRVPPPEAGWSAYFVELIFPSGGRYPFKFSTGVRVIPDTLPGPPPPMGKAPLLGGQGSGTGEH